ncbi:nitroreductase family protein [Ruminiclostridium cellobioparum]|jgi:nitroreductase|uniref:Nitroreductase family n=1 Tax=Ruminiclostridium cellobioparum subsp. termitidis CT1112 TaxID=1195236 RepID=S0FF11_RUMCE|nr:nitroreductase family protein [Ruminiclostridium cellobioparum]EMS69165.1 Nitroreductase family [Ruminiclostridium cellobioparum subsp. termitidis CT1112]
MDVFEVMKNRRSIREYDNIPIEKDKLVQILEAM